jgi:acetoin utilization deacetylase AcuC-like enzyme
LNVYFSPAYAGAGFAFETTRKSKWVADSLGVEPIAHVAVRSPQALTAEQLAISHGNNYVRAIQTGEPTELAQSQGFVWDAGLWPMVLASNGGMVAAALDALHSGLAGSLSSGLHHARRDCGAGYCTFNGLAIAARSALTQGAKAVLILDLDAHCGGGTASLIAESEQIWQIDVSVDDYDSYEPSGRLQLRMVRDGTQYLKEIEKILRDTARDGPRFDLCLYNAGMDPYEGCPDGGLAGISEAVLAARERMVFDWCQAQKLPVAFSLAGGYIGEKLDERGLVALHRLTLSAAAATGKIKTLS